MKAVATGSLAGGVVVTLDAPRRVLRVTLPKAVAPTASRLEFYRLDGDTPSGARPTIRRESRECSGARSLLGPFARAASTRYRLVSDFDPGTSTVASTGPRVCGAGQKEVEDESRGAWYVRQLVGAANIEGGRLFHVMSGNLSHQIEHHLFPDLPARRYPEIAVEVREICERYGLPYNTGSLRGQLFSVFKKIVRFALPGGEAKESPVPGPSAVTQDSLVA